MEWKSSSESQAEGTDFSGPESRVGRAEEAVNLDRLEVELKKK